MAVPSSKASAANDSRTPQAENDRTLFRVLRRGATGAFLVQVGGAGLGLVVHVMLARLMGADEYGVYTLALTWLGVLTVVGLLGQSSAVLRFVPGYVHRAQWGELRGLRRRMSAAVFSATLCISLCGAVLCYFLRWRIGDELALTLLVGFVLLPVLTQLQLSGAMHRALKRAVSAGAFNNLARPLLLLCLVLVFAVALGHQLDAPIAMAATAVGALGALALSEGFLRRAWPRQSRKAGPRYETRAWFRLGGHLFFLAAIGIVLNRVDVLVLGGLAGAKEVGPYYAAVQLAAIALYGLNSVNTILAPLIAERYAANDHAALKKLVHRAAWLTFAVTAAVSVATAIAGPWILDLFGPGFRGAYVPLLIVLGAQCVNAAAGPVGFLMTMTRFERPALWIFGSGAALNISLSVAIIPFLGIIGAAVATATATITWNVVAFLFVRKRLGVNPTILPLLAS